MNYVLYKENLLGKTDSLYNSILIDNKSYNNVYVITVDTTIEYFTDQNIWKAYFSLDEGIIAFSDRPSNSLFVRQ